MLKTSESEAKIQISVSKAFSKKLYEEGGEDHIDRVNRESFNLLVGTSPSNYRLRMVSETGLHYFSGKDALRMGDPLLAKAKSYQEILYLRGYSIEDATKVTQRTFKLEKVSRI